MKSVIVRLQEYEPNASNAEKSVVRYILEKPEKTVGCSIHQLSEKTFSSASTIIRLCRKAGFDGYKELQQSLLYELAVKKDQTKFEDQTIEKNDTIEEILDKVTYKNISSLEDTRKLIDTEVLKSCVDLIENAKNVYLFGIGASLLVAKDLYLKLLRVNKSCFIAEDMHAQFLQAKNITKDDLAIIISYSGITDEMITCANSIIKRKSPIISITRLSNSPIAKLSTYTIPVAATELIDGSGTMSSRISQLNAIDILYAAYVNRNYDENMNRFQKTHIRKVHREFAY